jgi:hypothetical protein
MADWLPAAAAVLGITVQPVDPMVRGQRSRWHILRTSVDGFAAGIAFEAVEDEFQAGSLVRTVLSGTAFGTWKLSFEGLFHG